MAILSCHVSIKLPPKISDGQTFSLHVNDEVAALTLPTWHQPGPVFPIRNECQCALRTWGRGKHQSGQSPSSFPLARNASTCPSPSSATRSPLVHHLACEVLYASTGVSHLGG